ncbi:hypothetical protein AOQ84DRAFT_156871 [Glonium stellatum]|uniref:Uncharacterized protein n=1 Tax=Glonium stellatum TaxID=574774 RepID=A0A8E2EQV7_9PEZI|nr:hypothetical protein AOQ84DRAFT_156871 [Glonium stellatum]
MSWGRPAFALATFLHFYPHLCSVHETAIHHFTITTTHTYLTFIALFIPSHFRLSYIAIRLNLNHNHETYLGQVIQPLVPALTSLQCLLPLIHCLSASTMPVLKFGRIPVI